MPRPHSVSLHILDLVEKKQGRSFGRIPTIPTLQHLMRSIQRAVFGPPNISFIQKIKIVLFFLSFLFLQFVVFYLYLFLKSLI